MPLAAGDRLGVYEITGPLGAGGMGEVYRARDTKLDRDVALKILPELFASDPDRLMRFEREAKTLATLNHPHIAQIHGLEESHVKGSPSGLLTTALVMELVEGEELAARIARGPIPLDEALAVASQIVEALEAAHEIGIIHRDLKPANIKLRRDGVVKVLDFGLAKALAPAEAGPLMSHEGLRPVTVTSPALTVQGLILGTAAYMSPEQARGKPVDRRTDIWAFGCVLYEMLTGRQTFESGDTVSDAVAAILKNDPDWSALPADTPAHIRTLLKRCLQKDVRRRLPHIGVARLELAEGDPETPVRSEASAIATAPSRHYLGAGVAWVLAAAATIAAVAMGSIYWIAPTPTRPIGRFEIHSPTGATFLGGTQARVAVSPDGTMVAFIASPGSDKPNQLYLRRLDSIAAAAVAGSDGALAPFWSPDSRFVAFFADNKLKKSDVTGGLPQTICEFARGPLSLTLNGTWGTQGVILFSTPGGIRRVSAASGEPTTLTTVDASRGVRAHLKPHFLPDGRRFLFLRADVVPETSEIVVGSLDAPEQTPLFKSEYQVEFARPNHLLFVRDSTLYAQRLDVNTLVLHGEPIRIADSVSTYRQANTAAFSIASTGVLVYRPGDAESNAGTDLELRVFDRTGKVITSSGRGWPYRGIDLSPDGTRVAAHRHDERGGDIWVTDLKTGTPSRFTFDPTQHNISPIWSPDGAQIAFAALRDGSWGIYRKAANSVGTEERLLESNVQVVPMDWSNNAGIVYVRNDPQTLLDIWRLPLTGDRKPVPIAQGPLMELHPQVSPESQWVTYSSGGTVYVQNIVAPATRYQVTDRGVYPRWRSDGREIFFMTPGTGRIMSVPVNAAGDGLTFTSPAFLFDSEYVNFSHTEFGGGPYHTFDVSADGQRIVVPVGRRVGLDSESPLIVVLNWDADLRR